jgi:hypothetical protein
VGPDGFHVSNFGFSIPSGATINSIEVRVKGYSADPYDFYWSESYIIHNGTWYGYGSLSYNSEALSGTNTYYTDTGLDGSLNVDPLWGSSLGATEINSSSFGYILGLYPNGAGDYVYIDHIEIVIDYTASGGGATPFTTVFIH